MNHLVIYVKFSLTSIMSRKHMAMWDNIAAVTAFVCYIRRERRGVSEKGSEGRGRLKRCSPSLSSFGHIPASKEWPLESVNT